MVREHEARRRPADQRRDLGAACVELDAQGFDPPSVVGENEFDAHRPDRA